MIRQEISAEGEGTSVDLIALVTLAICLYAFDHEQQAIREDVRVLQKRHVFPGEAPISSASSQRRLAHRSQGLQLQAPVIYVPFARLLAVQVVRRHLDLDFL